MATRKQASGAAAVKARRAKMERRHRRMAAAGKRTKVGQALGQEAFEIGTSTMQVEKVKPSPKHRTGKQIIKLRTKSKIMRGARTGVGVETISRVYSPRWETKLAQQAVGYKPFATQQKVSGESTAIYSMSYNPKTKWLWITFWKYKQKGPGSSYVYYGVPQEVWEMLVEASSKGRYFWYYIRGSYNYSRTK